MKGELAIEVIIDRSFTQKNCDAWRTVLDACLPVMHLIDTRRSMPYGIKQVEDLLGISCSFEQLIECLSASIKMVAKGVLKEHLILVANSMTCSGSILGFNDSKHVAAGTGSCYKIFWDKEQVKANQDVEKDVYDFLDLVQTTTAEKEVDVDDLMYQSEFEFCASPVRYFKSDKWNENNSATVHGESGWGSTGGSESWKSTAKTTQSTDGSSKAGTWNSPISEKFSFGRLSEPNKWKGKRTTDNEGCAWVSRGWGSNDAACSGWKSPLEDVWNTEGKARSHNSKNNHSKANIEFLKVEKLDEAKAADNGNNGWKSRGWSSTDGRRSWKNSFPRTGVKLDEQRGRNAIGSSSMKRNAEVLTPGEEQILFEVEPVFCSAKKILHHASIGEPLSAEHQQFIKEQVFDTILRRMANSVVITLWLISTRFTWTTVAFL